MGSVRSSDGLITDVGHPRPPSPGQGAQLGPGISPGGGGRLGRQYAQGSGASEAEGPRSGSSTPGSLALKVPSTTHLPRAGRGKPPWPGTAPPPDLPVSCLVPKESSAVVPTLGARGRHRQLGPLLGLSQASGAPAVPGAGRTEGGGGTRVGRRGPGHPRRAAL